MCRQFYRHCRDCQELFPMPEPDMREQCKAFQKALIFQPHLSECPGNELQVLRPPSGHGIKVCQPCRKRNREAQRQRENAQKRARRARLKKEKMTAGIGPGNVVWAAPNVWKPSIMDSEALTLHSPQPQRSKIFKVRLATQALKYALDGSISEATLTQDHIDVSEDDSEVYTQSCQTFAATTSNIPQLQENCHDIIEAEMHEDINSHRQHESEALDVLADVPFPQEKMHQPVGLGITFANESEGGTKPTETCSFSEWSFRMELNKWSTVFDENDDVDVAKDL